MTYTHVTKQEAQEQGLPRYFTGKPCKYLHVVERRVDNGVCCECKRLRQNAWNSKNKKLKNEKSAEWRANNPEYFKNWRKDNSAVKKESDRKWRLKNSERASKNHKRWRGKNKQRLFEYHKNWDENNRGKRRASCAKRQAAKLHAVVQWSDLSEIRKFYENCPDGHHVDHIIPLQNVLVSGLHVLNNLQYLPAAVNISKGNKFEPIFSSRRRTIGLRL